MLQFEKNIRHIFVNTIVDKRFWAVSVFPSVCAYSNVESFIHLNSIGIKASQGHLVGYKVFLRATIHLMQQEEILNFNFKGYYTPPCPNKI